MLENIENIPAFKEAGIILLYYSLPDEVQTGDFIKKWSSRKTILLPVIKGDILELKEYRDDSNVTMDNIYSIKEPIGEAFNKYEKIDLSIIPGVSFDNKGHRLGRGKGYYDKLLPLINSKKIGICFEFQVSTNIPVDDFDFKMDEVWTEKGKL